MTLITINIPEQLRIRLKEEENQSQLITRLLNDYYKFSDGSIEEKKELLKELNEDKKNRLENIDNDIVKVETIIKKKEEEIQEEQLLKDQEEKRLKRKFESRNNIFKEITLRDMTNDELKEFDDLFEMDRYNIKDYAEKKKSL